MDGNDYVDLLAAWGTNILGYGYPRVAKAMHAQVDAFVGVGLPYPKFLELGRLLSSVIPCADLVRFGKNGSDATMGAVRLARAVTGRDRVLHRGYHGFHDWFMASTGCHGIPQPLRRMITTLPELSPEAVGEALREHPEQFACLIIDPMVPPIPDAVKVEEIVAMTRKAGAFVIFDEIVTDFSLAPGGMQEVWGIEPDLACYAHISHLRNRKSWYNFSNGR